ncbi:MAG: gamma-glutamyltransferase [Pseudomonadales bacterium]
MLFVLSGCTKDSSSQTSHAVNVASSASESQDKDLAPEPESKIVSLHSSQSAAVNKMAVGKRFMAVTANPHATQAAYAILEKGGSAIDAAIAAQMVLGLVEPQSSGIGGGAFMLYWDADEKKLIAYDGREVAPMAADENLFIGQDGTPNSFFDAVIGGKSVGVPGIIKMLEDAHTDYGKKAWASLFDDAIALAVNGFAVSERLHTLIKAVPKVSERERIAEYLFDANGEPLPVGHQLKNLEYAKTLNVLAHNGSDTFYRGQLAQQMVAATKEDKNSGALSLTDFIQYQAVQRPALCKQILTYRVCGMGPPSSGASTTLAILGLLENLVSDIDAQRSNYQGMEKDTLSAHYFVEASRLAFADRNTYIADPDFIDVPVMQLLDDDYLQLRSQLISTDKPMNTVAAGQFVMPEVGQYLTQPSPELVSTTHLSIVDQYGNVVSMTSSIEMAFGSRLMVGGFILNNQLTDFSFVPRHADKTLVANRVQGGKRPRSSMSPMIVFDENEQPLFIIGSPGGKKIIPYVARVLYEVLFFNSALAESIEQPHILNTGRQLEIEKGASQNVFDALESMGHQPVFKSQTSGLHAISRRNNEWVGVADPRREGAAKGD